MGWSFSCDTNYTIADQLADFRTPGRHYSAHYKLLRSVRVGNHHWALLEDTRNGHHTISLDLMKGPNRRLGEGAGYKGMSEDWGPYYYDCPLSILDNARAPETETAYKWRQKVREYHAARKSHKAALKPGVTVKYGDAAYTLIQSLGRKGWEVRGPHDCIYRMKATQLARAKVIDLTEGGAA